MFLQKQSKILLRKIPAAMEKKKSNQKSLEKKYSKPENVQLLPWWSFLVGLFLIGSSFLLSDYTHCNLPEPLSNDKENTGKFIAENAWITLKELTSVGPRFTGTHQNEVLGVNYLHKKIHEIKTVAHRNQIFEVDHQVTSGSFPLGVFGITMIGVYVNVQNIVVKLHGDDTENSVMLNCHFDTVPGSPGASDDAANCAVMLELLRIFAVQDTKLKHSVIFLFNGAEEVVLQASHGFITQHKWAKEVRAFVNLESAGSGGKEILFQAGPRHPWLIEKYSHVPHPSAQTSGEEIFQSELIPSDTDFRIFRDHGHIPGLDFAHNRKGYRYHTKYDNIDYVQPNFLQHTGDNILELVRQIANSDELPKARTLEAGHTIFYDLFGVVFIHYDVSTGALLHSIVAILVVIIPILYWQRAHNNVARLISLSFIGTGMVLISFVVSLTCVVIVSYIINLFGKSMSWYGHPWLAHLLYGAATLWITLSVYIYGTRMIPKKYRELSKLSVVQGYIQGVNMFWNGVIFAMIGFGLRSHYIFFVVLTCVLLGSTFSLVFQLQGNGWIGSHVASQVPILAYTIWCGNLLIPILIPIMGRSGSTNAEMKIGILICFTTILAVSYLAPMIILVRWGSLSVAFLYVAAVLGVAVICGTNLGFPFVSEGTTTEPKVQRHYVTHARRTFYDMNQEVRYQDSGYWFRVMDRHTKRTMDSVVVPKNPTNHYDPKVCRNETFCGLPLIQRRELERGGYWVNGPNPVVYPLNKLQINEKKQRDAHTRLLNVSFTENIFTTMFVRSPCGETTIEIFVGNESIGKHIFGSIDEHYLQFTHGLKDRDNITLNIEVECNVAVDIADKWLDLTLVTHLVEAQKEFSQEFRELLQRFPDWTFVVPMVANIYAYQF